MEGQVMIAQSQVRHNKSTGTRNYGLPRLDGVDLVTAFGSPAGSSDAAARARLLGGRQV